MKILVAVPSYNRPYDIEKRVGWWLKQVKGVDFRIFVEPSQAMYYEQSFDVENIVETKDDNGFMNQIIDIGKYATKNKYDLVFKIDDDMKFSARGVRKDGTVELFQNIINELKEKFLNTKNIGAINIAKPMTYMHSEKKGFKARKKPIYGNYIMDPKYLVMMKPEMLLFDDLFLTIEVKKDKKDIYTYLGAYEDAITHTNQGGLQSFDRNDIGFKGYEFAKTIYPRIEELENSKNNCFDIDISFYLR